MCKASPEVLTASYVPNDKRRHEEKSKASFLVDYLAMHAWVPDREGHFIHPQDLTRNTIHPSLTFDDRNGWLTAVAFGAGERQRSIEYQQKNELARSLGFDDAEHMDLTQKATKGKSREELMRMTRDQDFLAREEFPEKSSPNPERRRIKMVERRENAPAREKVQRERTIEKGLANLKAEAKAYLRGSYTNANGRLICQCCRDPMPFKLPKTEEDYFEAVQFLDKLDKQLYENYLALCPTCSAKYQHACQTDVETIKRHFLEANPNGIDSVEISIQLVSTVASIRFVAVHALDLHAVLGIQQ
jgi:hypothetical protein